MKRKNLYALALLLFLSTVAFSNDRARYWCGTSGKVACPAVTAAENAKTAAAAAEESTNGSENHLFLHTFIKLLYI